MNSFRMQCENYLLVNGWVREYDGWEWVFIHPSGYPTKCDSIGDALEFQLEWDDGGECE